MLLTVTRIGGIAGVRMPVWWQLSAGQQRGHVLIHSSRKPAKLGTADDVLGDLLRAMDKLLIPKPGALRLAPSCVLSRLQHAKERLHTRLYDRGLTRYLPVVRMGPDDLVQ